MRYLYIYIILLYHMGVFVSALVCARSSPYWPEPPGEVTARAVTRAIQKHPYDNYVIINVL